MIQEFSVENFLSIKEKQIISFEATTDNTSKDILSVQVKPNVYLLKMAIIYGANASGKSNIILAIDEIWSRLFYSNTDKHKKINFVPFALTKDNPTKLSIIFYKDEIKYQYSISYNNDNILYELLEYAPYGVMSLFYKREYDKDRNIPIIKFGNNLKLSAKVKDTIIVNTFNNHSVLSTFAKITIEAPPFEELYMWIKNNVHNVIQDHSIFDIAKKTLQDQKKKQFFLELINKADFNIVDWELIEEEIPEILRDKIKNDKGLPDNLKEIMLKEKKRSVEFLHQSNDGNYVIPDGFESAGTSQYFNLIDDLYNMVVSNHIYLFDEIESNLHYDLLIHFLTSYILNSNYSQLIFTTHDQSLLDEDFIRRDMIWFTQKSKETGSTEIYSAVDFRLHKNISLYKAYKVGKLGAKPEIGSPFINLD
jgi:AAA15 family ATPase/GTPase